MKELIRRCNKGISTIIALVEMIAFVVVGLGNGYFLNSGITGTSVEFPEHSEWRTGNLSCRFNNCSASN
jgi:FlaG/FlaF family flagellin (archaellin)